MTLKTRNRVSKTKNFGIKFWNFGIKMTKFAGAHGPPVHWGDPAEIGVMYTVFHSNNEFCIQNDGLYIQNE